MFTAAPVTHKKLPAIQLCAASSDSNTTHPDDIVQCHGGLLKATSYDSALESLAGVHTCCPAAVILGDDCLHLANACRLQPPGSSTPL